MLKLFYSATSCALASRIALEDAGADYELVTLDLASGAHQRPEYLAINPKSRVPALLTDRGVLTETPAILVYIAQTFPKAGLMPVDDAFAFAEMQSFNAWLCSTVHVSHAHGRRGPRWATQQSSFDDMKQKVPENMAAAARLIEDGMLKGPWVMGEQYTVADPYLYLIETWLAGDGVDIANYPRLQEHYTRMSARESVRRALQVG